jgi:uncharacterized membrane protein
MRLRAPMPLRPPVTDFAVALWAVSLVFDLLSPWLGNSMVRAAFYDLAAGSVLGLVAATAAPLDYNRLPDRHPARGIALLHGFLHALAVGLFFVSMWLRAPALEAARTPASAVAVSGLALGLVAVASWLGGRVVHSIGLVVGPVEGPASDAPATLRPRRPVHP